MEHQNNPTPAPTEPHGSPPQGHGDPNEIDPKTLPRIGTFAIIVLALAMAAVLAGLFLLGWVPHHANEKRLESEAKEASDNAPAVEIAKPSRTPPKVASGNLSLPGDAHAMQETSLYSRTNGYLKKLHADIGDRVKEGQLLAEIDTPEVDSQLEQAKAQLEQVNAGAKKVSADTVLAKDTFKRYEGISATGGVTKQLLDEKHSAYDQAVATEQAANASIAVAQAEVGRLTSLQGFEKITAPFAGTVTSRNFDVGALLSGSNTGPTSSLFRIAETDTLRVFVDVPQAYITLIKRGDVASYNVRNYPGRTFHGSVARTTGEIDLASRTQRYEVHFPNPDGALVPGMYGQVEFDVHSATPPLMVPSSALVFASEGLTVAVVDEQSRIHMHKVTLGRDYGTQVEVTEGLTGEEDVVTNPGERLAEGLTVRLAPKQATASNDGSPPPRTEAKKLTDRSKP